MSVVIPGIPQQAGREFELRNYAWVLTIVTLMALVLSYIGESLVWPDSLILLLNMISYIAGGAIGARAALTGLREGKIDIDLLMILAALGAAIIGQWHEGAVLLFLFSLSNVLQEYALERSRRSIRSLFKLYPEDARLRRDGEVIAVALDQIQVGDTVLIRPGERIPVDGIARAGGGAVDQAPITGESIPVDKTVGDRVFAGTLNQQGALEIEATQLAQNTTLARIVQLVEEAQSAKAPTQSFLDRFEQRYAKLIIGGVALFILIPPLVLGMDFESNFYRGMVLMTVASPCALIISVPASFISAIAAAARAGALFKGGAPLEHMAGLRAIAFDKTGTLTCGKPRVTDVVVAENSTERELLTVAASLERQSEHPLAQAILEYAGQAEIQFSTVSDFEAVTGQGVKAVLEGRAAFVGKPDYCAESMAMPLELSREVSRLKEEGKSVMGVALGDRWLGLIAIADRIRPQSAPVVQSLKDRGVQVVMLSGDHEDVARAVARQAGIERVYADLMPDDKVAIVEQLKDEFGVVAMVGDGVNDAPALAVATVGIAMGAAGSDVALETADVVLMGDQIERIDYVLRLSRRARRVVWQNITFSIAVIVILVLGAFFIDLPLSLGVLGHEGSTVIVVLNGIISLLLLPEIQRRRKEGQGQTAALSEM